MSQVCQATFRIDQFPPDLSWTPGGALGTSRPSGTVTVLGEGELDVTGEGWSEIPGPEYYSPNAVEIAFESLLDPAVHAKDAAASLRRAVGNDHAGTLYPAAVAATVRLIRIIESHPGKQREIALSVLLDWWGMFQAEPGYEVFIGADGEAVELIPAIIEIANSARPAIEAVIKDDPGVAKKVGLLLKCLDTGWKTLDY